MTIRPQKAALVQLNQTLDYSYETTLLTKLQNDNTSVVRPYIPQENWGMPAYVAGLLVWGSPPIAVRTQLKSWSVHRSRANVLHPCNVPKPSFHALPETLRSPLHATIAHCTCFICYQSVMQSSGSESRFHNGGSGSS